MYRRTFTRKLTRKLTRVRTIVLAVSSKSRITALTAGLAVLLALVMLSMLSVVGFFAIQSAEASIQNTVVFDSAKLDAEQLIEPFRNPPKVATTSITASTATVSHDPVNPGATASYTFSFLTPQVLQTAVDEIVITFDDEYAVPATLDRNQVTVSSSLVLKSDGSAGGSANEAVAPLGVSLDFVSFNDSDNDSDNDEPEITLRVPDMATGDDPGSVGVNSIAANALVTIVFRQSAGITNPTESGADRIDLRTSKDLDNIELKNRSAAALAVDPTGLRAFTPVVVESSSNRGSLGANLSLTARGVEGGQLATFWLDANGDGIKGSAEADLCSVMATGNDVAVCNFTVASPPFSPGTGTDCDLPALVNCNFINVVDGENRTTTGVLNRSQPITGVEISRQTFDLGPDLPATDSLGKIEFTGVVQSLPGEGIVGKWRIQGLNVSVTDGTKLKGQPQLNSVVEVEGNLNPDGVVQAKEINVKEIRKVDKVKKAKKENRGKKSNDDDDDDGDDDDNDERSDRGRSDEVRRRNGRSG